MGIRCTITCCAISLVELLWEIRKESLMIEVWWQILRLSRDRSCSRDKNRLIKLGLKLKSCNTLTSWNKWRMVLKKIVLLRNMNSWIMQILIGNRNRVAWRHFEVRLLHKSIELTSIAYFPEWKVEVFATWADPISNSLCEWLLYLLLLLHALIFILSGVWYLTFSIKRECFKLHCNSILNIYVVFFVVIVWTFECLCWGNTMIWFIVMIFRAKVILLDLLVRNKNLLWVWKLWRI